MDLAKKYLPRYTYEDYKRWKGDWELVEGVPYAMSPSPQGIHQRVLADLLVIIQRQLRTCVRKCYVYPELDWIIDENTVVRPDVVIVCKYIEEYLRETPEVIIEIVSPSSMEKDERLKFELYEREGVSNYILVYPDLKVIKAFRIREGKYDKYFDADDGVLTVESENCKFDIALNELFG